MYKEKLKNYIDNTPEVSFIISEEKSLFKVEFKKENDSYYFINTEVEEISDDKKYNDISEKFKFSLDELNENVCKVFVEKYESMILEQYLNIKK